MFAFEFFSYANEQQNNLIFQSFLASNSLVKTSSLFKTICFKCECYERNNVGLKLLIDLTRIIFVYLLENLRSDKLSNIYEFQPAMSKLSKTHCCFKQF